MLKKIFKKISTRFWTSIALRKVTAHGKVYVNRKSTFTTNTYIGDNCHFNGMRITGAGKVKIGDNFHSGCGCLMITSNHNYNTGTRIPYDNTLVNKDIIIEDNVWIGENVTILGGVIIGEGAIIQAGSVVVTNIPACAVAGGHPARKFSERNREHYFELKEKELFF